MRPRPSTASAAATTMTVSAKIWPSAFPSCRANAINARLPAFSISSSASRMISGLRRMSTPNAPVAKRTTERIR
jgi:hypothetical protein